MKNVMITGGAKGIGRAIALEFASKGYNISFCYNTSLKQAESLEKEITDLGVLCIKTKCDLTNEEEIINFYNQTISFFKHIDILINNAGISYENLLLDTQFKNITSVIETNLTSTIKTTKLVVENMLRNQNGSIINIASIWGEVGASNETVYSASKAGIIGFTKALAKELAYSNIRVNCVSPGATDTDMLNCYSDEEKEMIKKEIPLQRFANVKDISSAVYFLSTSPYITGQILSVNGGFVI